MGKSDDHYLLGSFLLLLPGKIFLKTRKPSPSLNLSAPGLELVAVVATNNSV